MAAVIRCGVPSASNKVAFEVLFNTRAGGILRMVGEVKNSQVILQKQVIDQKKEIAKAIYAGAHVFEVYFDTAPKSYLEELAFAKKVQVKTGYSGELKTYNAIVVEDVAMPEATIASVTLKIKVENEINY